MAEFTSLRAEVSEDLKSIAANLQYAATLSGGVTAWILSKDHMIPSGALSSIALGVLWWLPFLLSCLFGGLSLAINRRIKIHGEYLCMIETKFRFTGLGWEQFYKERRPGVSNMYYMLWCTLIGADFVLGLFGALHLFFSA